MHIEVAYALLRRQIIYSLEVKEGTTAREAACAAPVLADFPEAKITQSKIGIFGKMVPDNHVLKGGDRVEIYRPLIADPKEIRKQRAAAGKRMKKGCGNE